MLKAAHKPFGSIVCSSRVGHEGAPLLGIVAKRSYRLHRGRCDSGAPAELHAQSRYTADTDAPLLIADSDEVAIHKSTTDVVLAGAAYSHGGLVRELSTRLAVGAVEKRVNVIGDRSLNVSNARLSATQPQTFERMALSWRRAYGGRDVGSEELERRARPKARPTRGVPTVDEVLAACPNAYPRNRHGVGFAIDVERARLAGTRLPNQSDPDDPVTLERLLATDVYDWADRPSAAGYGPIDLMTFPRVMLAGVEVDCSSASRPLREFSLGVLDARSGAGPFNCAAPGLGNVRLAGDEDVELTHLHPRAKQYGFALPGQCPRMVIEPPGTRAFELDAKLATVLVEPDEERVTLTWAGVMPCAAEYPEPMCQTMRHAVHWS